jgi:MerR family transcriptional regulator, heat shock protein HspR
MSSHFNEPLFVISVAARLVKMHPQTLRKYEREGLIAPSRTQGNLRLYSDQDIERLRQVKYLVEDRGLNLAGVQMVLEITRRLRDLRAFTTERGSDQKSSERDAYMAMTGELDRMLRSLGFIDEDAMTDSRRRDNLAPDHTRG